jgi:hypothetical protein
MTSLRLGFIAAVLGLAVAGTCIPATAQTVRTGSISGTVTDQSAAPMPGVTVTLTSPALQVPQLVKTTDGQGGYQFVDLPLGTYRVAFELSGFSRLIRDDLSLPTGFAARVDAVLKLASLEETVTVSGQSPIIDVTNTRGGATITSTILETIPNSRTYSDIIALTPGLTPSAPPQVGQIGFGALTSGYRSYGVTGQERVFMDGVNMQSNEAPDFAISEEVDTKSFGTTAETPTVGAQIQMIVKSGGNDFHGRYKEEYINHNLNSSNVDAALRAQGISAGDALVYSHDFIGDVGGRIVRNKVWFYGAYRNQRNSRTITGYSLDPGPDGQYGTSDDTPGQPPALNSEFSGKLSYQMSAQHKFVGFFNRGEAEDVESFGSRFIPFESTEHLRYPNYRAKGEWQGVLTDRLLTNIMFGDSWYYAYYNGPDVSLHKPATLDRATQIQTGASFDSRSSITRPRHNIQFNGNVSYFPAAMGGGHSFKAGYSSWWQQVEVISPSLAAGNYQLVFDTVSGAAHQPVQLNVWNRPTDSASNLNYYAGYVTDTWRMNRRVTANLGVRVERSVTFVPASSKPQGQFGTGGDFPRIDAGAWVSIAPRAGVAYDINGNAKTVVKASYGWYNNDFGDGFAAVYNLNNVTTTSYRWHDLNVNKNYDPGEADLSTSSADFISVSGTTNPVVNLGLKQPVSHEIAASLERELGHEFSLRTLYVYRRQRNLYQTVNPLRPYSAFDIPIVRQDPGADGVLGTGDDGGNVTLNDYEPAFRGGAFVGQEPVNRPAGRDDFANSFEVLVRKRSSGRWGVDSSVLFTKNHRWLVGVPQSPNDNFFPLDTTWEWNYRLSGSYRAGYGVQFAGFYTLLNGAPGQRTYLFRNIPNLSTQSLRLEPFGSERGPERSNLNLRVAKRITFGSRRVELSFDALNATNNNVAWTSDYTSGPTFNYSTRIATPRAIRLGLQFDF